MSGSSQMKPSRSFPPLTRAWTTQLPMIHAVSWYICLSCSVYLHYCLSPVETWLGDLCLNITHFSSSIHSLTHFIQQAYFKQSLYMHNKKEIKRKGWLKHGPGAQPSHFMGAQTYKRVIICGPLLPFFMHSLGTPTQSHVFKYHLCADVYLWSGFLLWILVSSSQMSN